MAENAKAQRLLAAKKLVKEYQKKNKKTKTQDKTPTESLTNSTHSSLNETPHVDDVTNNEVPPQSQLVNYFNNVRQDNQDFYNFDRMNFGGVQESLAMQAQPADDNAVTLEDPEIKPNEIFNRLNNENENVTENMESLKQLSTHIIQLIDDNASGAMQNAYENKQAELTLLLEGEKNKNIRLMEDINLYQEKINQLQHVLYQNQLNSTSSVDTLHLNEQLNNTISLLEVERRKNIELDKKIEFYQKRETEMSKMNELLQELERQEQTVKFLVAEKTDLEKLLSQKTTDLNNCQAESAELNARLKTSRSRVATLERDLNSLRESRLKNNESVENNEKFANLKRDHYDLLSKYDEMSQDTSELQEKFNLTKTENLKQRKEIEDLNLQLSMANIKLQQVSTGVDAQSYQQIEDLKQKIQAYEQQIVEFNNYVKHLLGEKEQAEVQYQQYALQLNQQINNLAQKLEGSDREKEILIGREQQLTNQMGELEKLLQKLQDDPVRTASNQKELAELRAALDELRNENSALEVKYQTVIGERDESYKELTLKRDEIEQLEGALAELRNFYPDNDKILAEMESDKVAASRAVAQNEQLKKQLEEMETAFIKICNEKLELTEMVGDEKHKRKEIQDQMGHLEAQIHTLTDAIGIKDKEMVSLRESAMELNKYQVQQTQLEDRLRHYEAQDNSKNALQRELQQSYQRIQTLTTENDSLKLNMKILEEKFKTLEGQIARVEDQKRIQENQIESDGSDQPKAESLSEGTETDLHGENLESREVAMRQLEEKFTRMMKEIADLEDEKQRLEHLVTQLQDETETIGEYVALYQHQRGVLKQRALEKEEEMRQLSADRRQLKEKIEQLNALLSRALNGNGDLDRLCKDHVNNEESGPVGESNNNDKTVEKIMELLKEIETSSLVQPSGGPSETFHPCPVCRGHLITV